jgi:hypothetical protein
VAKTSISIDPADLAWLRARARRHHRGNLSAAVAEATEVLRHHERMRALMNFLGPPVLTEAEKVALDREIDGAPVRARSRRAKRAA